MEWILYDEAGDRIGTVGGRVVVCTDETCENVGLEIEVADDGNEVVCGPCGATIAASGTLGP